MFVILISCANVCRCAFVHLNSWTVFFFAMARERERIFLWSKWNGKKWKIRSPKPYLPFRLIVDGIRHFCAVLTANSPYSVALLVVFAQLIKTDYWSLELYHHGTKENVCIEERVWKCIQLVVVLLATHCFRFVACIVSFMNINSFASWQHKIHENIIFNSIVCIV